MPDREPLPPGVLPNVFDTDPPPLNPATEVGDGYVRINKDKLVPGPAREAHAETAFRSDPRSHPEHPEHHTWLAEAERHLHARREATGKH